MTSLTTQECTTVKITRITTASAAATVVAAGAFGLFGAPFASAETTTQPLGSQGKLVDGNVVQGWTITGLRPSSDTIPYPVAGTLWEATATDQAIQGSATPIVSNLNARAANGQTYRSLFGVATPQGVNPATLAPGQQTSGKVYFDVTGETPDSVVYNAGGQDLLVWVQPPPSTTQSTSPSYPATTYPSDSATAAAPAATPATPATPAAPAPGAPAAAPGATPAAPAAAPGTVPPAGSQGTPIPAGSQGTPVPPAEGAPLPASTGTTQQPAGSQGTPLPPSGEQVQTPTTYVPTP
jgi:hypothetical protein